MPRQPSFFKKKNQNQNQNPLLTIRISHFYFPKSFPPNLSLPLSISSLNPTDRHPRARHRRPPATTSTDTSSSISGSPAKRYPAYSISFAISLVVALTLYCSIKLLCQSQTHRRRLQELPRPDLRTSQLAGTVEFYQRHIFLYYKNPKV